MNIFRPPNDWLLEGNPNSNELTIPIIGGRLWSFKGLEDPDSIRGWGPAAIACDEYASVKGSYAWNEIIRPALSDKLGKAIFVSSPKGKTHFKELFDYGLDLDVPDAEEWASWLIRTRDVGTVPKWELENARRQMGDDFYDQEYEGKFLSYTGLAAPEFEDRTWPEGNIMSVQTFIKIIDSCTFFTSMDWAKSSGKTAAILWAVTPSGQFIAIDELITEGGSPGTTHMRMRKMEDKRNIAITAAGHDMWAKESFSSYSVAQQFEKYGRRMVQIYERKEDSLAHLRDLCNPTIDEKSKAYIMPKFMVLQGKCRGLVGQLCTRSTEDLSTKVQGKWDAFDACLFGVISGVRGYVHPKETEKGPLYSDMTGEDVDENPVSGRPVYDWE